MRIGMSDSTILDIVQSGEKMGTGMSNFGAVSAKLGLAGTRSAKVPAVYRSEAKQIA
jgi:hypothetical protein